MKVQQVKAKEVLVGNLLRTMTLLLYDGWPRLCGMFLDTTPSEKCSSPTRDVLSGD